MDENVYLGDEIKPNAIILKYRDNAFHVIKFERDGDFVSMSECTLDAKSVLDTDTIKDMAHNEFFYVRINFDFDYDAHEGVLEFDLCEQCVLAHLDGNSYVYAEDLLANDPDYFIEMYLNQIE